MSAARPRPSRSRSGLVLLAALLVGACATAAPRPQALPADAAAARDALEQRWRAFSDLRTLANLQIKRNALGRQAALLKRGFTTRADYEDALNEVRTAETDLSDARARAANATAAVAPGEQPQVHPDR